MENVEIEAPSFDQMTNAEMIDYHLEHGEGSGGLEGYVRRLNQNPDTVRVAPGSNPSWNQAIQLLEAAEAQRR